jgi:hypothetical protein
VKVVSASLSPSGTEGLQTGAHDSDRDVGPAAAEAEVEQRGEAGLPECT